MVLVFAVPVREVEKEEEMGRRWKGRLGISAFGIEVGFWTDPFAVAYLQPNGHYSQDPIPCIVDPTHLLKISANTFC